MIKENTLPHKTFLYTQAFRKQTETEWKTYLYSEITPKLHNKATPYQEHRAEIKFRLKPRPLQLGSQHSKIDRPPKDQINPQQTLVKAGLFSDRTPPNGIL